MQGTRVNDWDGITLLTEGQYAKSPNGIWFACSPTGYIGNLSSHSVIENEDSTITVSPSILITTKGKELYHGFLERGIWRSC